MNTSKTIHLLMLSLFLILPLEGYSQSNNGESGKTEGEKLVEDASKKIKTLVNPSTLQKKSEEVVTRKLKNALDSLTQILVTKGKVCLDTAQRKLATMLKPPPEDSVTLANLTISVLGSKVPMSYPYKVAEKDTLSIQFKHLK